jgi:hypothetical protein
VVPDIVLAAGVACWRRCASANETVASVADYHRGGSVGARSVEQRGGYHGTG